jgi:CBS domain-containing protein
MKIRSLYQASVMQIPAFRTLLEAARRMRSLDVGALAVLDGDVLRGIITERDLVQAMSDEADPRSTLVTSYMSTGPVTATPDDDSAQVVRRMLEAGVRHLPVMEAGRVVGMVSIRDLASLEAWQPEAEHG